VYCVSDRGGLSRRPLDTASVGVHLNLSSQVGGALSLTPGDDQDGRWGDILSPGSLGFRFRVVYQDTKPYSFWHHKH
jgi:hypothetical protein